MLRKFADVEKIKTETKTETQRVRTPTGGPQRGAAPPSPPRRLPRLRFRFRFRFDFLNIRKFPQHPGQHPALADSLCGIALVFSRLAFVCEIYSKYLYRSGELFNSGGAF